MALLRHDNDDIAKVDGLSPGDAKTLRVAGIGTRGALVALVGKVAAGGIDAATPNLSPAERKAVCDVLARYVLSDIEGETRPLPIRVVRRTAANWREVALFLLLIAAACGVTRAIRQPEQAVVAKHDLVAFQVIDSEDVEVVRAPTDFSTFAKEIEVLGRFPLRMVKAGEPLRRDSLSRTSFPRTADREGRRIVSIPIDRHSMALAVPRTRVDLLLSPRSADDTGSSVSILTDAIVVDAQATGDTSWIVVALRERDLSTLTRLLASSQVFVVQGRSREL